MEKNFNPIIGAVEKHRSVLNKYGEKFGMEVFTVREEQLDLDFQRKKMESVTNGTICLTKPFMRVGIQKIPIMSVAIKADADGSPYVSINDEYEGKRIHCSLSLPKFDVDSTDENIRKALISGKENGNSDIYFSNLRKLEEQVTALNRRRMMDYKAFIEDLNQQVDALTQHISADRSYTEKYYNSINSGKSIGDQVVLHAHTETVEE